MIACRGRHRWPLLAGIAFGLLAAPVQAQDAAGRVQLDATVNAHRVSGGFGDWRGAELRLAGRPSARDTWYLDALWQRAFGDEGIYASASAQRAFTPVWSGFLGVGSGSGDFFFPDVRVDAVLTRKWGAARHVLTNIGTTIVDAKRGYRDAGGMLSLTAYAGSAIVMEAGGRLNRSAPGAVTTGRGFGSLTLGRDHASYVVLRGSTGQEGYQLLGPSTAIRRFQSSEGAISWRQWLGRHGGFVVQGERYRNDAYARTGVSLGFFADW
jgi:YaiO family outer membrane protein